MQRGRAASKKRDELAVFELVENNSHLIDLLVRVTNSNQKAFFIKTLLDLAPNAFSDHSGPLFIAFTSSFGNYTSQFPHITAALKERQEYFIHNRSEKRRFIAHIGLDWTAAMLQSFLSQVKVISLARLKKPYPPTYHWMVESDEIDQRWRLHIEERPQPDLREPRCKLFSVDPHRLQYDIPSDESVIINDGGRQAHFNLGSLIL